MVTALSLISRYINRFVLIGPQHFDKVEEILAVRISVDEYEAVVDSLAEDFEEQLFACLVILGAPLGFRFKEQLCASDRKTFVCKHEPLLIEIFCILVVVVQKHVE